jgi:malate synthase
MTVNESSEISSGIHICAPIEGAFSSVLNEGALGFLHALCSEFGAKADELLLSRIARQAQYDEGVFPNFLTETEQVRKSDWTVAPIPPALLDRRVEITGPVDRKMVINALNSGANTYMADFEDSSSPAWSVMMNGQANLRDAITGTIEFTNENGKIYSLNNQIATLLVRPRGWHLKERHILFQGLPVPAGLVDFGLFFYNNAAKLVEKGVGPYFYLPKMESYLEARLWNDVFKFSQDFIGINQGSIRATVLIETIPAAFEMDEILWELRDHSAGLNCGRWDYIFSFIKCFRKHPSFIMPDRAEVEMSAHFLNAYSQLLIKTCHRRGVHAMGGMAAQIPIKNDDVANKAAFDKVRADKEREARNGHDGTWVAHPGLIAVAKDIFDELMPADNQIFLKRDDVSVTQDDLLTVPAGQITIKGLETNVSAALHYTEQWISGFGCVPLNNLMEDAATAEISRTQIWQWLHHETAKFEDGTSVTEQLFIDVLDGELKSVKEKLGDGYETRRFLEAADLIKRIIVSDNLADFLTLEAYSLIVN